MLSGEKNHNCVPWKACELVKLHSREGRHPDVSSRDPQNSESETSFLGLVTFSMEESDKLLSGEHEIIIF